MTIKPTGDGIEFLHPDRAFIIAEAGVNHNGDISLAHKLIDAAVDLPYPDIERATLVMTEDLSVSSKED